MSDLKDVRLAEEFKRQDRLFNRSLCGDDNRVILIAPWKGTAELFNLSKKEVIRKFRDHEVLLGAWCTLSRILTIGDRVAILWDGQSEKPIIELRSEDKTDNGEIVQEGDPPAVAAFSPNGELVAVSLGSEIRILDAVSGNATRTLAGHKSTVSSLAFNNDGSRLYSGDRRGNGLVWDLLKNEVVARLPNPSYSREFRFALTGMAQGIELA